MEIVDCTDLLSGGEVPLLARAAASGGAVRGIAVPGAAGFSRREVQELEETAKAGGAGGLASVHLEGDTSRGPLSKYLGPTLLAPLRERFQAKAGDLLLLAAGAPRTVSVALGRVRLDLGARLGLPADRRAFLWVVEFPLLERTQETGRLSAVHHPFTAPLDEDLPLLSGEPLRARAKTYDLVLNGVELGGGSIRIHRQDLQARMFDILGISPEAARERFGFLLDAFQYGAPPHGGIALGLDRVVMVLGGQETIREVIAFPKTQSGADLMTGAPSPVDQAALDEVHIGLKLPAT